MFAKTERLDKHSFDRFFRIGKRYQSQNFTLVQLPFTGVRVAVVVGKKVFKKAVLRNQLRRRIYSIMRNLVRDKSGVYIVLTKPGAAAIETASLSDELSELVERTNNKG